MSVNRRIVANVTATVIRQSRQKMKKTRGAFRYMYCPIALALQRVPGVDAASVGLGGVSLIFTDVGLRRCRLSKAAQAFIRRFDAEKSVRPARFAIVVPR